MDRRNPIEMKRNQCRILISVHTPCTAWGSIFLGMVDEVWHTPCTAVPVAAFA